MKNMKSLLYETKKCFSVAFGGEAMRKTASSKILSDDFSGRRAGARRPGRALVLVLLLAGLSGCVAPTPARQGDICEVFAQQPDWYDHARASRARWGTPMHVLMAFVRHESSFRSHARPPIRWFFIVPLGRASSARGYAQALDGTWREYKAERGMFRSRSSMKDALDFIGWYNYRTRRELGISLWDARRLYLAYHEGQGGYRRGTWKRKPGLQRVARRVAATARRYRAQIRRCESRFRCGAWYQVWPFCR